LVLTIKIYCELVDEIWHIRTGETIEAGLLGDNLDQLKELMKYYHFLEKDTKSVIDPSKTVMDKDLVFILAHTVELKGLLEGSYYVPVGSTVIDSIPELSQYFGSDDFIVGSQQTYRSIDGNTDVLNDTSLLVMKRDVSVVLEFDNGGITVEEVAELVEEVSVVAKVAPEEIIVEVEANDQGRILRVTLFLSDSEVGTAVNTALNELDKSKCSGVICRTTQTYLKVKELNMESARQHQPLKYVISLLMIGVLFRSL